MKVRKGFVSNSSSSSFVIITAGEETLYEDGDTDMESCGGMTIMIDDMIEKLLKAKAEGHESIYINHGGGYEG
jgi:hypothetical protein